MEITDLNKIYLDNQKLNVEILGRGFTWLDAGTHDAMLQASNFIQSMELNKGEKIACIEEIAITRNLLKKEEILNNIKKYNHNAYFQYVSDVIKTTEGEKYEYTNSLCN